jgi:carbamoylphosphate synthase large subunit
MLVTAAGGALAPLNIRLMKASQRHDVWVAAVDTNEDAVGRHFADHFTVVPKGDDPGYADAVAEIVKQNDIDIVLPWSDEEALSLAGNRERIEETGAVLTCTSSATLQMMNDKAVSFRVLEDAGISVPDWSVAEDKESLQTAIDRYRSEKRDFVVKPIVARGNRGTFVIRQDVDEISNYLGSRELHMNYDAFMREYYDESVSYLPNMVMERLFPPAYDIDVLAQGGRMLRVMPRERMNPAGIPFTGGILRPRENLLTLAERVTAVLKLDWLYDYDLMTRQDGEPVVIELNPRPSGSIAAAILAGVPFYEDLISLTKGEPLPEVEMPSELSVVPYIDCSIVSSASADR